MKWIEQSRSLKIRTYIFKIYEVIFKSSISDKEGSFDVLEARDWANVIAITNDQKVIMENNFALVLQK